MKHINLSQSWGFSTEPFPAFRSELVYGRNKRDREFLPVKDVEPIVQYTVTADSGKTVLYEGSDKSLAEVAKARYDAEQKAKAEGSEFWTPSASIKVGLPELPTGKFRIIKTKEKGTIMVVPGIDETSRCLLFVGCTGGFRGDVGVLQDGTTGTILKTCSAGNACQSGAEAIVLLETGQSIVFHSYGRRTNEVYEYTWDGINVEMKHFSKSEWDSRNTTISEAEVEVL